MTSAAFDRFVAQLHAEGREKGDGFDHSHFDGLTPDEKPRVRQLLTDALLDGDSTAANGLLLLDPPAGTAVLERAFERRRYPDRVGLSIAGALWKQTRDPKYVDALLPYVRCPAAPTRLQALFQLQGAPCSARLIEEMRVAVLSDTDETNRSYAGKQLLFCLSLVHAPEDAYHDHRATMLELRSPDEQVRRAALDRLLRDHDVPR